jgi:hypothetical protein
MRHLLACIAAGKPCFNAIFHDMSCVCSVPGEGCLVRVKVLHFFSLYGCGESKDSAARERVRFRDRDRAMISKWSPNPNSVKSESLALAHNNWAEGVAKLEGEIH